MTALQGLTEDDEAKGLFAKVLFGFIKPTRGGNTLNDQQRWELPPLLGLNSQRPGDQWLNPTRSQRERSSEVQSMWASLVGRGARNRADKSRKCTGDRTWDCQQRITSTRTHIPTTACF